MKILYLSISSFPSEMGGVSRIVFEEAKAFSELGHFVEIWTLDYKDDKLISRQDKTLLEFEKLKILFFKGFRFFWITKQFYSFKLFIKILKTNLAYYDLIVIPDNRNLFVFINYILLLIKKKPKTIVHKAFGSLAPLKRRNSLFFLYSLYDTIVLKPFLNKIVTFCLAQTKNEILIYQKYLDKNNHYKIKLLPLSTNVKSNISYAEEYSNILKQKLKLKKSDKIVLFLGRITANKGILNLISAFNNIYLEDEFLVIVGYDQGGYKNKVENQILELKLTKNCFILNSTHGNERFGYYYDSQVFAITSNYFEETSLASLEALSCGTRVLLTPEVSVEKLLGEEIGIISKNSIEAISKNLRILLNKPKSKSLSAISFVSNENDIFTNAKRIIEFIEK